MKKLLLFIFALFLWTGAWADSKTVYLRPSSSWAASSAVFDVYVFNNTTNGWISMDDTETIDGVTCYKAEIPDTWTSIVFVRKNPAAEPRASWDAKWGDNGAQTPDVVLSGIANNTLFTISDAWGESTDGKTGYTTGVVATYTAKFVTNASWADIRAYAWSGESGSETKSLGDWPGKSMSDTGETYGTTLNPIYSVTFTTTAIPEKIIFNDGTTGAVGTNQTTDLDFVDNGLYVVPIALPSDPTIAEKRVLTITGFYGEKAGAYAAGGMDKTTVLSGRNVYHAETPSADARIEGIGIGGLATKQMEKLHLAVWTKESVENAKIQVYSGGWQSATKNLTGGQWNVFDIALDEFSSPLVDAYALRVVNGSGAALGTEIYITDVFFYNEGSKPMFAASIVSHTGTSVDIKMSSYKSASATTDAISYTITWTGDGNKVVNKANGDEFTETIDGLTQGNTYTFSITAKDDNNVVSDAKELTVTLTVPPTSVPYPSQDNSNVISVYSQKFGDITGLTYGGDWTNTEEVIDGSKTRKIEKLVYGNFSFTSTDMSTMEKLHFDVYPMENMPQIGLRVQGVGVDSHYKKVLTLGTWNRFDIDLSEDLGLTTTQLENINNIQIVSDINGSGGNINGDGTGAFYIGNVYFWKNVVNPSTITSVTVVAASSSIAEGKTTQLTVTDQLDRDVTSLMTFESSDDDIATVDASGLVTAVAKGTARITATVTGYGVSSYIDITVTEAPLGFDLTAGGHTIHVTPYHYVGTNNYKLVITSDDAMKGMGGSFWNINGVGKDMRANDATQTFTVTDYKITITTTSTSAPNIYTPIYMLMPGEVNFGYVDLDWIDVQEVSISSYKWASFSSSNSLDFGKVDGLTAYIATDNSGKELEYNTVNKVPASTGLLLNADEGTYDVPVIASAPALVSENLLKPAVTETVISAEDAATGKYYAFGRIGENVGFVKMAATGYTVSAGKSYLLLTAALAAKGFDFIDLPGSETDGINKVNTLVETGVRYNLAGQRVGNDYKGIVVVNGKKYLRK